MRACRGHPARFASEGIRRELPEPIRAIEVSRKPRAFREGHRGRAVAAGDMVPIGKDLARDGGRGKGGGSVMRVGRRPGHLAFVPHSPLRHGRATPSQNAPQV